jgi:hypothetical protein
VGDQECQICRFRRTSNLGFQGQVR